MKAQVCNENFKFWTTFSNLLYDEFKIYLVIVYFND